MIESKFFSLKRNDDRVANALRILESVEMDAKCEITRGKETKYTKKREREKRKRKREKQRAETRARSGSRLMETSLEGEGTPGRFVSVQMGRFGAKRRDPPCLPLIYRNFTSNWLARVSTESSKRTCRSARLIICSRLFLARPESSNLCLVSTRERVRVTRTAPVALSVVTRWQREREKERDTVCSIVSWTKINPWIGSPIPVEFRDTCANNQGGFSRYCWERRGRGRDRERERKEEFRVVLFISRNNGCLYPVQDFPSRNT